MKVKKTVIHTDCRRTFEEGGKWSYYDHGISASGLQLFLRCPEQFRLNHQEDYDARYCNTYLQFGTAIHLVLHEARQRLIGKDAGSNVPPQSRDAVKKVLSSLEKDLTDDVAPNEKSRQEFETQLGLATIVGFQYGQKWWMRDRQKKWIDSEREFSIDYDDTHLNGTMDAVFEDGNGYWILDTKTKSQVNEDNIQDSFIHDVQFMLYMVAGNHIYGDYPRGIIFDGVRRPGQKITQKDKDFHQWLDRVEQEVIKEKDHYFFRFKAEYGKGEVKKWEEQQLKPMLRLLKMWYEKEIPHWMNPQGLIMNHTRSQYFNAITKGDYSDLKVGAHWRKYEKLLSAA